MKVSHVANGGIEFESIHGPPDKKKKKKEKKRKEKKDIDVRNLTPNVRQLRFQKRKTPAGGFSYQHLWYS